MATTQISVNDLSIAQLSDVRKQVEGELEHYTSSFAQLKAAQGKFTACIASVREVAPANKDQPILVPLTNSLYVPGKLADAENVLVDIGTGYFVKKTRPQAVKYYQAKVELLRKNLEALQDTIAKRQENLNAVMGILQQKVQAQVQATGPGKAS